MDGDSGSEGMLPDGPRTQRESAFSWKSKGMQPHPVLSIIPPKVLKRLLNDSAFIEVPKGEVVFRQGDPCCAIFLIVSGRCESRDANGEVERVLGPGDTIGERAFLNREPYRFTAVVSTHCVLLRISTTELLALFDEDPSFAGRFSQALAGRFQVGGEAPMPRRVQRIVSLLSLTKWLDDRAVVARLAEELRGITGQQVLMVHFGPGTEAVELDEWPKVAGHLNGAFIFREHITELRRGVHELRVSVSSDACAAACVPPLLSHCGRHFDYVVLHVAAATPVAPSLECLIQSDLAFVLVEPDAQVDRKSVV